MRHAMIDLETLATTPDAHILTIAARAFDPDTGKVAEAIELPISDRQHGRRIDVETIRWWEQQSEAARSAALLPDWSCSLRDGLVSLRRYLTITHSVRRVWCCGPSFDTAILEDAYAEAGIICPWLFHQVRDVRTICEVAGVTRATHAAAHRALADVDAQIAAVIEAHGRISSTTPRAPASR
jgi:exodeoxyribonuclease VIII